MDTDLKREGKKKRSIRWIFFGYCIILVLIMIAFVWTIRLLFLDNTYRQVRIGIAEKTAHELANTIETGGEFKEMATEIAGSSDTSIVLFDGAGNRVYSIKSEYKGYVLTHAELTAIRESTLSSQKGTFSKEISTGESHSDKVLIYARNVSINKDINSIEPLEKGTGTIIITFRVAPTAPTLQTINIELVILSLAVLAFAFVLSYFMAKHISSPIVEINRRASRLGKGDYAVRFDESGYKEVSELAGTLNYTTRELDKSDRMRKDLIANVSHDLRTPLTMIRGYIEMMIDMPEECNIDNMNIILKETDYLTSLVNDMLDMSKLEANVIKFKMTDFDLNELLVNVTDRYNMMYIQHGYTFTYVPLDRDIMVNSDKVMITNVLYNLINNAVNHIGADKHVDIVASIVDDRVTVHVIDKGEGIPESKLATIWDRYYKAERNLKRESTGSGLGLSIVKTVLTKLDAGYGVTSEVDKGSDFYFDMAILESKNIASDSVAQDNSGEATGTTLDVEMPNSDEDSTSTTAFDNSEEGEE